MSASASAAETAAAETPIPGPTPEGEAAQAARPRLEAPFAEIAGSLGRLAELQVSIWLTGLKMAVFRIVLLIMLCLPAMLLAIVAAIFLYAGVYHVLTDLLAIPTAWALLIFAGAHILLAGMLVGSAIMVFNRRAPHEKKLGGAA